MGLSLFVGVSGAPGHTANKRRQPLDFVNQTLVDQEVECAIHGRRRRTSVRQAQSTNSS
jgi:hypothetical protein